MWHRLKKYKVIDMNILESLKGKKMMVKTDMGIPVELEIKEIKESHHSEDIGPSTKENDWYPEQRTWTTFDVIFTNGSRKSFQSLSELNVL